jgi:hypothetical protein
MREATRRVNTEILQALSKLHGAAAIARNLNISKQLWHNYKSGMHDVSEPVIVALCEKYGVDRERLEAGERKVNGNFTPAIDR